MKKVIIWGTGAAAESFVRQPYYWKNMELRAVTDGDMKKWNTTWEAAGEKYEIISPYEMVGLEFDVLIICTIFYEEIQQRIEQEFNIEKEKIIYYKELQKNFLSELSMRLFEKYNNTTDVEIQEILKLYKREGFNIFGSFNGKIGETFYVKRDSEGMPYIMLEGKRLYYPRDKFFQKKDGKECVFDVIHEHKEGSPHQYIRGDKDIMPGSVIVDAGVCEGNFALRYIEKVKKAYLIEADARWMEALSYTFKPYKDKVVFCNKFLTSYDSAETITLDTLIDDNIDFLKMDIEGAETEALLGGKNLLRRSHARCAICSYHRQYDESNIKFILEACGYHTSVSKGYMCFIWDPNIMETLDFRRGIVYGERRSELK